MGKTVGTQRSAIDKRGDGMPDNTPLPSRAELAKLLEKLLPENEQMDSVSAAIILEREGIGRAWLANALRSRLERRIAGIQARGEVAPPPLDKLMSVLNSKSEVQEIEVDAESWVDSVLEGKFPQIPGQLEQPGYIQAFRPRATENLTDEDIEVLREMAQELDERSKERE